MKTFEFDFKNKADWESYEALCQQIQEQVGGQDKISMLINNKELFEPYKGKLHKRSDEYIEQTLNTNIFPQVFMSRFFGPALKARMDGSETHSAIITMTSYYSQKLAANMPLYSSCKSF